MHNVVLNVNYNVYKSLIGQGLNEENRGISKTVKIHVYVCMYMHSDMHLFPDFTSKHKPGRSY